ncbi:LacI family DNA-binding transcriptional regulator [Phycicoccus endophyticus]|nr:LacI family DNA-binding transcriptional regulator [Phycicoccus endophyticus]
MKDIAAELGVSVSTVSLVLNNRDQGRVNSAVAQRIRDRAEELGYVPNLLARGLKTKRSHTLGLLADRVATVPFAGPMLAGAQRAAWEEGFLLLVIDTGGDRRLDTPATQSLLQRDVEALVVAADFHREVVVPPVPASVPTVVLDGWPDDPDSADGVVPDEVGGATAATEHLIAAGHRRIAMIGVAGDTYVAARLRRAGYENALRGAGIQPDPDLQVEAPDPSSRSAVPAAEALLTRPTRPTAIFCFSDQIALTVSQVASHHGLRIPEDLSLVGFDNQQYVADAMIPGLTTVQLPHDAMGEWAARRVIARIRGETDDAPVVERIPCGLVERSTVAPPAADPSAPIERTAP